MKTHVYKLVLGFVLILFALNLNAQEYSYIPLVKPGVQIWSETSTSQGYRHYNRFALTEDDTIIDSDTYKKLYWFQDSVFNPLTAECIGGLRENTQKQVFYKGKLGYDNEFWHTDMLYDFSLSLGDTFFDASLEGYSSGLPFEVVAVDTVEIDGTFRRKLTFSSFYFYDVCTWTEGIGNNLGLLFETRMRTVLSSVQYGELRCYEDNGGLQYMAEGISNCGNPFLSIDNIALCDNSITLYPNPSSNKVNISSQNIITSIEVFNSLGQKVYQTQFNAKEKTIDINSLSKGVYIIGVSTEKGYIKKKLIKN